MEAREEGTSSLSMAEGSSSGASIMVDILVTFRDMDLEGDFVPLELAMLEQHYYVQLHRHDHLDYATTCASPTNKEKRMVLDVVV